MINHSNIFDFDDLLNKVAGSLENYYHSKWLYALLLQLFNNRNDVEDPLGEVEQIYEYFDYPEEIESFFRFMPVVSDYDPTKHTPEENIKRSYSNWEQYLIRKHNYFSN